jgi:hypothetical protein
MGTSTSLSTYTYGSIINNTCLYQLTRAINLAYSKIDAGISAETYLNLIGIGSTTIPALGNSKPSTYTITYDDSNVSMTVTGTKLNSVIVDNTTGLLVNGTVVFNMNIGTSILANVVYYVSKVVDSTHFQISVSLHGATKKLNDIVLASSAIAKQTPGEITSHGFLRQIPYQAYNEFYINNGSYSDFVSTFATCFNKKIQLNETINGLNSSKTYLDGIYSNMNDLITSDITGVNSSTFYWGQDLIASGRAIDLSSISTFGEPVNLLRTLSNNRAFTNAINYLLISAGFTDTIVNNMIHGSSVTTEQQKLLYTCFSLITGNDLSDVCTILNCQTVGLDSLADLLDPKKLFPNSYTSLTYPQYNAKTLPTNSKTYYLIYQNGGVNISNTEIGTRLKEILPKDLAYACDGFSIAMTQIKNISNMNIEKFSQVVNNLENVNGLGVNGTNIPTNTTLATAAINSLALGSGPNGVYTMCDFFGSMTNLVYPWSTLQSQITQLGSSSLATIYNNIYNLLNDSGPYTTLQTLIDQANNEISSIYTSATSSATTLNTTYAQVGTLLKNEKNARDLALPTLGDLTSTTTDITSFVDSIDTYAQRTELYDAVGVLESISDTTTTGGNSLIASMREARNKIRLGLTGAVQDNDVNSTSTSAVKIPRVSGSTLANSPIAGYDNSVPLAKTPIITGAATVEGSLGGSPETTLITDNLSILIQPASESVLTPSQAVADVILCNCDCWENL